MKKEFKKHKYIVKCIHCKKETERDDNHFADNVVLVTISWCKCIETDAQVTQLLYNKEGNRIY